MRVKYKKLLFILLLCCFQVTSGNFDIKLTKTELVNKLELSENHLIIHSKWKKHIDKINVYIIKSKIEKLEELLDRIDTINTSYPDLSKYPKLSNYKNILDYIYAKTSLELMKRYDDSIKNSIDIIAPSNHNTDSEGLTCKVYNSKEKIINNLFFSKDGSNYAFLEGKKKHRSGIIVESNDLIVDGKRVKAHAGYFNIIGFNKNNKLALQDNRSIIFDGKQSDTYKMMWNERIDNSGNLTAQVDKVRKLYPSTYYVNGELFIHQGEYGGVKSGYFSNGDFYYIFDNYHKYEIIKNGEVQVEVKEKETRLMEYIVSVDGEISYIISLDSIRKYKVIRGGNVVGIYNDFISGLEYSKDGKDLYFTEGIGEGYLYKNGVKLGNIKDSSYLRISNDSKNYIFFYQSKYGKLKDIEDNFGMPGSYCDEECLKENKYIYVINGVESQEFNKIIKVGFIGENNSYVLIKDNDDKYSLIQNGEEGKKYDHIYHKWNLFHYNYQSELGIYLAKNEEGNLVVVRGTEEIGEEVNFIKLIDFYTTQNGDLYYLAQSDEDTYIVVKNGIILSEILADKYMSFKDDADNKGSLFILNNGETVNFIIEDNLFLCSSSEKNSIEYLDIKESNKSILDITK